MSQLHSEVSAPSKSARQVVIVTGAGAGLGRAIAQLFHEHGVQVAACDIAEAGLAELAEALPGVKTGCFDIADAAEVARFVSDTIATFGGISTLVNNVGIPGPTAAVEDVAIEDWQRTVDVNLNAIFNFVRVVVPQMKMQRSGCIVNVSTTSARTGLPMRTPYVVSKAALSGLTRNLARELGPFNIRCNTVLPGAIRTERGIRIIAERAAQAGETQEEAEGKLLSHISMRTWIDPTEIAEMIFFLASDRARHVSGQEIGVCGNMEWE